MKRRRTTFAVNLTKGEIECLCGMLGTMDGYLAANSTINPARKLTSALQNKLWRVLQPKGKS